MTEIETGQALVVVGFLGVVGFLAAPLLAAMFCARPVPRWMRVWRDMAAAIVLARTMKAGLNGAPLPLDLIALLAWAHLVTAQLVVALANWWNVSRRNGDRCAPT